MGGRPWHAVVPFVSDIAQTLRRVQDAAVRPPSDATAAQPTKGGGVLDVRGLAASPGFLVAGPFSADHLEEMLGTSMPGRGVALAHLGEVFSYLDRGEVAFIVLYDKDGNADEVLFAGYSSG